MSLSAALNVETGEVPQIVFHFTPTSASWLNLVGIWLRFLTLRGSGGRSLLGQRSASSEIGSLEIDGACDRRHTDI